MGQMTDGYGRGDGEEEGGGDDEGEGRGGAPIDIFE
jgi:hypothetical protein